MAITKLTDRAALRNADFRLLQLFCELVEHRHAQTVAQRMHITAPAVSHALTRLRELFGEPLFIRRPQGLEPTRVALELAPKIQHLLRQWQDILQETNPADLLESESEIRIVQNGFISFDMVSTFLPTIRAQAPRLKLSVQDSNGLPEDVALILAHKVDVACTFGALREVPANLRVETLGEFEVSWVCARKDHPILKEGCTLAQYLACEHMVMPQMVSGSHADESPIDVALGKLGVERPHRFGIASWGIMTQLLTRSDMVFSCSNVLRQLIQYAEPGIVAFPLPFKVEERVPLQMIWHVASDTDAVQIWFRDAYRSYLAGIVGKVLSGNAKELSQTIFPNG